MNSSADCSAVFFFFFCAYEFNAVVNWTDNLIAAYQPLPSIEKIKLCSVMQNVSLQLVNWCISH